MKKFVLVLVVLCQPALAYADGWRFRAREHFEMHHIKAKGQSFDYTGTSNTINFWYEKPHEYAIGLAGGPVLGNADSDDSPSPSSLGKEVKLITLGIEAKYFFYENTTT